MSDLTPHRDHAPAVQHVEDLRGLRAVLQRLREMYEQDPEAAHSIEDALKDRVLHLTTEGHPMAADFAREVLAVAAWDVPRWCA